MDLNKTIIKLLKLLKFQQNKIESYSIRSGKTSIKNVVFHKMEPSDTLFLDPTTKTNLEDISCSSFITFQVYDCSGQIDLFSDPTCDSNALLKGCGSLIFVIDAQVRQAFEM